MWCPHCDAFNWGWRFRCVKCRKILHVDLNVDAEESTSKERRRGFSRRTRATLIQFLVLDITVIAVLAWYGSGLDWAELFRGWHAMPFYILALTPLYLWITVFILLSLIAKDEAGEVQVNLLTLAGAVVGLCSCGVAWDYTVSYGDLGHGGFGSVILLLAFPFTLITPLASVYSVAALLIPFGALQEGYTFFAIEPISAYLLGWVSVGILFASMWTPFGLRYDGHWRLLSGHRLWTLHFTLVLKPSETPP